MEVRERRTRTDWAEVVRKLVDEDSVRDRDSAGMDSLHPRLQGLYNLRELRKSAAGNSDLHGNGWIVVRQCLDRRCIRTKRLAGGRIIRVDALHHGSNDRLLGPN